MMMMSCHYFHNHLINISICWWWWWRSHTLNEKRHKTSDQLNGGCTVNENYSEGTNFKIGQIQNVAVVDEEDWVIGVKISLSRWFFQKSVLFLLQTMSVNLYSLYVWSVVSALENDKPTMSVDILMFSIGHLLMFLIGHISMFSIGHLCKSFLRSNYVFGGRNVGWSVIVHWDPD